MAVAKQARKVSTASDKPSLIRELVEIADYIAHLRNEIAALRANELTRDRLPMAHEELGSVVAATAGATNSIMNTAERSTPQNSIHRHSSQSARHEGERRLRCCHLTRTGTAWWNYP